MLTSQLLTSMFEIKFSFPRTHTHTSFRSDEINSTVGVELDMMAIYIRTQFGRLNGLILLCATIQTIKTKTINFTLDSHKIYLT